MINLNLKDWLLAGLGLVMVGMVVWCLSLRAEVQSLTTEVGKQEAVIAMQKIQISSFVSAIDRQNEAIEGLRISTKAGIDAVANKAKTIETRYSTVKVKDDSCEAKLAAYNELIGLFVARGAGR